MQEQLDRIEAKLDELLGRKKIPRQTKIKDTRTLEEQIQPFRGQYPPREIEKFISYWGERKLVPKTKDSMDKTGLITHVVTSDCKQRWQLEKTWEIDKRLKRWMMNVEDRNWEKEQRQQLRKVEEKPIHREDTEVRENRGFSSLQSLFSKYE